MKNENKELLLCCRRDISKKLEEKKISINLEYIKQNCKFKNLIENEEEIKEIRKRYKTINEKNKLNNKNEIDKNKKELVEFEYTNQAIEKLYKLELGIKSNIPMLIQGPTSAGKSYL